MENLRKIRLSKGLKTKELGEAAGVSESMIGMIENGQRKPGYETLLRLSEALDCSVDEIINGEKIPAIETDDGMQSDMMLDLSKLNEDQQRAIQDILRMTKQQMAVVGPMLESLVSGE